MFIYRYSGDYTDPLGHLQQLKSGQNNNGYVPYVDYARDYSPPPQTLTAIRTSSAAMNGQLPTGGNFSLNRHRTTELRQDNGLPSVQNSLNSLPNGFLGEYTHPIYTRILISCMFQHKMIEEKDSYGLDQLIVVVILLVKIRFYQVI